MTTQVCHTPANNNGESAITYPIPPNSPSYCRIGIKLSSGSTMIQNGVTHMSFKLRNYGNATGNIYARCSRLVGTTETTVALSEPIDITTIDNTLQYHQFEFSSSFDTAEDDFLSIDTCSTSGSYNNWLTVSLGDGTEWSDRAYKWDSSASVATWDAMTATYDLAICLTYGESPSPSGSGSRLPPPPIVLRYF